MNPEVYICLINCTGSVCKDTTDSPPGLKSYLFLKSVTTGCLHYLKVFSSDWCPDINNLSAWVAVDRSDCSSMESAQLLWFNILFLVVIQSKLSNTLDFDGWWMVSHKAEPGKSLGLESLPVFTKCGPEENCHGQILFPFKPWAESCRKYELATEKRM